MNNGNRKFDGGGVINMLPDYMPEVGDIVEGYKLDESKRGCRLVETDDEVAVKVKHVVKSDYVKGGFYVIGTKVRLDRKEI